MSEWKKGFPSKPYNYYLCKVKGKGHKVLYYHICRESGRHMWMDVDWNEVKSVMEWTEVKK